MVSLVGSLVHPGDERAEGGSTRPMKKSRHGAASKHVDDKLRLLRRSTLRPEREEMTMQAS